MTKEMMTVNDFLSLAYDEEAKVIVHDLDFELSEKMEICDAIEEYDGCIIESFLVDDNTLEVYTFRPEGEVKLLTFKYLTVNDFLSLACNSWAEVIVHDLDFRYSKKMKIRDAIEEYGGCIIEGFETRIKRNILCICA